MILTHELISESRGTADDAATVCGDTQADVTWSELARSEASTYPTVTVDHLTIGTHQG